MKRPYYTSLILIVVLIFAFVLAARSRLQAASPVEDINVQISSSLSWTHLSTVNGDLDPPSASTQQTASLVLDINKDGVDDLVSAARQGSGPSMVWYKRQIDGWQRFVIDSQVLDIEAGGAYYDIDQDGDIDIVMGGDYRSNQVWWWENPYPNYDPGTDWTRRLVKDSGSNKHHDQMFGDFDDDGKTELVFWNQSSKILVMAEIPADPHSSSPWPQKTIYSWSSGSEHEGLAQADIDLDGLVDIVGAGRWFKYNGDGTFTANIIDSAQTFSRSAAGQLKKGGRPEVVFVVGDGSGRLKWYEWDGSQWQGTDLLGFDVDHGHSLQLEDINEDGHLDIFVAEMRLNGGNSDAKMWIFLGDGSGGFATTEVAEGYGNHESKLGDLDGDGDVDIFGKPYNWETPRLDIWLNDSVCGPTLDKWERHVIDSDKPERSIFIYPADLDDDGFQDVVTGGWWYKNPGSPSGTWTRQTIGAPLNNVAAIYDFDGDGYLDILGTEGVGSASNDSFVWANNDGSGNFTIRNNIDSGDGDFLQGVAADEFVVGNPEVALSWHAGGKGIQVLDVPADPQNDNWPWRKISSTSQDEALSSGDIDRDGDRDLLLGTKWLRNDSPPSTDNGWAYRSREYRVLATVDMEGTSRNEKPTEFAVNYTALLDAVSTSGTFDENSIRVVEVDGSHETLNINVPYQFDPDSGYNAQSNASGTMIVMQVGKSQANTERQFHIYFNILDGPPDTPANITPQVIFNDGVMDAGQVSYEVETNTATYYYHKDGGGFSSLVDASGNDWINHSDDHGSAGDYRGIPNLVYPSDGGYFHPGRTGMVSTILSQGPLKASFHTRSADDNWEAMWEIYPDYAQFTVLKAAKQYWFLYEGTPGGLLDMDSDFVVRSDGTKNLVSESWTGDISADEWLYFSDPNVNRSLYFVHHEDDALVDSYYAMNNSMTVFGFGRNGTSRHLSQVPEKFTIGLVDQTDVPTVKSAIYNASMPLAISLGTTEKRVEAAASGPWSSHELFQGSGDPDRNRLADINNDGRLDAVIGYEAINVQGKVAWYEQPGTATNLWEEHIIADDVIGPMSLDVADMDGDNDLDVVVGEHYMTNESAARVLVYENPGNETDAWIRHVISTGDEHHDGTQLIDIDNDGDLDVISIGWGHNRVLLYENQGCVIDDWEPVAFLYHPIIMSK